LKQHPCFSAYQSIPIVSDFTDENGVDKAKEQIQLNHNRIKEGAKWQ
jgi:hypothetical protein